jgi:maltose alpha-D-glucosyltransferase/alpha-amylase
MQWSAEPNAGFSTAAGDRLYAPVINDPTYGYQQVNVESQRADPDSLLHTIRHMVQVRKALPMVAKGRLEWLQELPPHLLCFWRRAPQGDLLALHNLADEPAEIALPEGMALADVLDPAHAVVSGVVTLPPYGYRWLRLLGS